MNDKRSLRVWILSDGRAGHYNQSRGIVRALESVCDPEIDWIDMRLRAGFLRSVLRNLVNRWGRWLSVPMLHLFYRFRLPRTHPDLIISAGGKTSFANAWLAQVLDVRNIFAGSLRRIRPDRFSVVLTLEASAASDRFLVLDLPPSAVDPHELQSAAARFLEGIDDSSQCFWTLLLGGDGAGYRYRQTDWQVLAQLMAVLARERGIRWLVVGSRRTGFEVRRLLEQTIDAESVQALYWFGREDGFSMNAVLGVADKVLVTEDSMTMLTEAIYGQKPVYSLRPQYADPAPRYERALQRMEGQGWLCRHAIAGLLEDPQQLDHKTCCPLQQSPLLELGERLIQSLRL